MDTSTTLCRNRKINELKSLPKKLAAAVDWALIELQFEPLNVAAGRAVWRKRPIYEWIFKLLFEQKNMRFT